jgi:hypothetical protein
MDLPGAVTKPLRGGKVVPVVGQVAKAAGKAGKVGKIGALGIAGAATLAGAAISSEGEESSSPTWEAVKNWLKATPIGLAVNYSPVALIAEYGFDKPLAEMLTGWAKELVKKHPLGVLMSEAVAEEEPEAAAVIEKPAPDFGPRVEREEGQVPKLVAKGPPEGRAQKFERYTSDLQRKVERSEHFSEMARINAEKARMQESQRHGKAAEEARKEYSAIRVQQQQLDTEMAKQYAENRQNQLEGAFDSIDAMWQTAIKNEDLGEERFVQHAMGVLLPYMDQLQEIGQFGSREETQAGVQQLLTQGFEDPTQYQWLKLMLQQAR